MRHPYVSLNIVFGLLILAIIIYAALVSPDRKDLPVPSVYTLLTGKESISTGLTHSFSEIVRFNFQKAYQFNPYGLRIFIFFMVQLLFRIRFLGISIKGKPGSFLINTDIFFSLTSFFIAFWPFITDLRKAFHPGF